MDKQRIQEIVATIQAEDEQYSDASGSPDTTTQHPPYGTVSPLATLSKDELLRLIAHLILAEDTPRVVDSTPNPPTAPREEYDTQPPLTTQDDEAIPPERHGPRLSLVGLVGIALVCLLVASTRTYFLLPLFRQEATITITPTQRSVTTTALLVAAPGSSIATTIGAHLVTPPPRHLSLTVPTTGKGHHDATVGTGVITFYNGLPQAQTIASHTILRGTDGIAVETTQAITLPPAQLPTEGTATVSASTLVTGPQANIQADDIAGACCSQDVLAYNSTFSGGTAAQDFPVATASDITTATTTVTQRLTQAITQDITTTLTPGETYLSPTCHITTVPSTGVGAEAATLTIQAEGTCTTGVYTTTAIPAVTTPLLQQEATNTLGEAYHVTGTPTTTVKSATIHGSTLTLATTIRGIYTFTFSQSAVRDLQARMSHLTKAAAYHVLHDTPSVAAVQITASSDTLPDTGNIHMVIAA